MRHGYSSNTHLEQLASSIRKRRTWPAHQVEPADRRPRRRPLQPRRTGRLETRTSAPGDQNRPHAHVRPTTTSTASPAMLRFRENGSTRGSSEDGAQRHLTHAFPILDAVPFTSRTHLTFLDDPPHEDLQPPADMSHDYAHSSSANLAPHSLQGRRNVVAVQNGRKLD